MFEYELPDVGEGVAEGEIVVWHVDPGDRVTEDEVLAEVETDKAVVDLPSPVDGVVRELHAEAGDVVAVGRVVVSIDTDAAGGETDKEDEGGETDEDGREDEGGEGGDVDPSAVSPADTGAGADGVAALPADSGGEDAPAPATGGVETNGTAGRVFAPPKVRRLARELGVDIGRVEGSGPSGRVTEGDVRAAAADDEETATESAAAEKTGTEGTATDSPREAATRRRDTDNGATATDADRDRTLAVPATRRVAREHGVDIDEVPTDRTRDDEAFVEPEDVRAYAETQQADTEPAAGAVTASEPADAESGVGTAADTEPETTVEAETEVGAGATESTATGATDTEQASTGEPVRSEPYRGIRRTIGERMAESAATAPHATHHDTAVVPGLVEAREQLQPRAEEAGVSLTYTPFVLKAVAAVLPEYPALNAELDEEAGEIRYHERYDIGVAVATDAGLMVPVIEAVDRKGLLELAAELGDLVEGARNRDLAPADLQGSTFTVTNFGAIGGEYATPILNNPETGILGLGELRQRPVVEDGAVVAEYTLPLSVSIDHRVVDGAEAAGFCNDLKTYLADPVHLLL